MKLLLALIAPNDAPRLLNTLAAHHTQATQLTAERDVGGCTVTFLIGVEDDEVQPVLALIREVCAPHETNARRACGGGATVCVLPARVVAVNKATLVLAYHQLMVPAPGVKPRERRIRGHG